MISTQTIKELRERTGVSMMACKKSLEAAGGNFDKALLLLAEEGARVAEKKADRALLAGTLDAYLHATRNVAALVDLRSETDFVAKNPEFLSLAHDLALHVAAASPISVEELLNQDYVKDASVKVSDVVTKAVQKFGENIRVERFVRYSLKD